MRTSPSRWNRPRAALALLALLLPTLASAGVPVVAAQSAKRPNVVLIVLDDANLAQIEQMPNVQRLLADQGTTFTNFFVTTPLCCPSRASILRGQYVHNHGVKYNFSPGGGFPAFHNSGAERSTIATWLRAAGYRTGLVGKYLNDFPEGVPEAFIPPGWNDFVSGIRGSYFDYTQNVNGKIVQRGSQARDYQTDVESRFANGFAANAPGGAPFFLYLNPRAPHKAATPAPRHRTAPVEGKAPRTPSFNEEDLEDKPRWVQNWPPLSGQRITQIDQLHRQQIRSLLAVDDMVARLVATLESTEQLENTYIFFTSDNGWMSGQHRIEGKGEPYEESIRVPLIVRGPNVPEGATVDELALNIDLAPTVAELSGARTPAFVDGRSLVPLLGGTPPASWRQSALIEYVSPADRGQARAAIDTDGEVGVAKIPGSTPPPTYQAVRTAEGRIYIEYATGEREYYDLTEDADQMESDHANPDRRPELAALAARLGELRRCQAATCRTAEDAPLPPRTETSPPPAADQTETVRASGDATDPRDRRGADEPRGDRGDRTAQQRRDTERSKRADSAPTPAA